MEPSILFAQIVLGMCAIHLIRELSQYIAQWWANNRSEQNVSPKPTKKAIRNDWYVFFSCADLWGKDPGKKFKQASKSVGKEKTRRDRRPVARV